MTNLVDKIGASVVRTVVPLIVGFFVTAALKVGVHVSPGWATDSLTVVVSGGYYSVVRWLETRYSKQFGWLLGWVGAPKYVAPTSPAAPVSPAPSPAAVPAVPAAAVVNDGSSTPAAPAAPAVAVDPATGAPATPVTYAPQGS